MNNSFFRSFDLIGKDLIEFGCGVFPSSIGLEKIKCLKHTLQLIHLKK